ncbi:hypothetical protein KSF_062110 [Reticulibacter mediterranei]|uniref:DUF4349 domain-containing protein n=1 Tax=Reticulibacter mediterranei TaxID=2778369 RepID=A0A8J3IPG4_9CHLR|nr:DUF4349 domain-containing protein [Reticulibacter mediterranei]GHO96163.1 hypothetical protein KSF_062110 [Reticulibacter mediterranei]
MQHIQKLFKRRMFWLVSSILLLVLLAACGAGAAGGNSSATSAVGRADNGSAQMASAPQSSSNSAYTKAKAANQQEKSANLVGPQYLIKSLKVSMQVTDTRKVADDLQNWITLTDTHATSAGMDYQQIGSNLYNVTMTFSVQASIYPKIQQYLGTYPAQHGGQLLGMTETVQDVTSTYVDTQSRLKNLRVEQARLQELMSQAKNLTDLLTVEQRLSDVEGQIESTQAQLNTLTNQVMFYPITISLQSVYTPPTPPPPPGWSAGQVFKDALSASLAFGQGLASFLIWLLAFSVYIIPVVVIIWLVRRFRLQARFAARPKMPPFASFVPTTPPVSRQQDADSPTIPDANPEKSEAASNAHH